jgi:hypothetical protein
MQIMHLTAHFRTQLIRVMKLTTILLLVSCLQVTANGLSQTITIKEHNAKLETVFKSIKEQSGYSFFYNEALLDKSKPVSVKLRNATLPDALDQCFKDQPLTYSIIGKNIVVKEKAETGRIVNDEKPGPQAIDVSGRVIDEKGDPLEGITVTVKGTGKATATNSKGEFLKMQSWCLAG